MRVAKARKRKAREVWLHPRGNEYRPMWWFCREAVTPVEVCYQLMHPKTAVLFREVLPPKKRRGKK